MKEILFVEDDANKVKRVKEFLDEVKGDLPPIALSVKMSYQTGLTAILRDKFDLILLDMSMHNFDRTVNETGGEFMQFAGEDILKEMLWNDIMTKTIIVTQYDLIGTRTLTELKSFWQEEFAAIYLGTVFYSVNESNWKGELFNLITKAFQ